MWWLRKKYTAHHGRSASQLLLGCCSLTGATVPHMQISFHTLVSRFFHRYKKHGQKLMLRGSTKLIIEVPQTSRDQIEAKEKMKKQDAFIHEEGITYQSQAFHGREKMLGNRERKEENHQVSQRKRGSRKDLTTRNGSHYMQLKYCSELKH